MRTPAAICRVAILALMPLPALAAGRTPVMLPMFSQEIILMQPEGWQVGYQHRDAFQAVVEFEPLGQTSTDTRESLTVEAYRGLAGKTAYGPEIILKTIRTELEAHCSQPVIHMPLEATMIGSYRAYVALLGCPELTDDIENLKAGEGTSGLYVSIKGRQDFYVIRHRLTGEVYDASQPPINPQNFLNYVAKTSPVMLCELGDTQQTCLQRVGTPTP